MACQPEVSPPRVVTSIPTPARTAGPVQSPTSPSTAVPVPSPPPETLPTQAQGEASLGTVTGKLCYPSSLPPPITLFLQNKVATIPLELNIAQGQTTFTIDLPPGEYTASAQTVGTELAGTYSQAVACGGGPNCTDHRLLPFQVEAGQTTPNIDLCDWYVPPGVSPWPVTTGASPNEVRITTLQNMHLYTNPTLIYPPLEIVPPRTSVRALAQTEDGFWLQIAYPAEAKNWIYAPLLQITGQAEKLPVITPTVAGERLALAEPSIEQEQFTPTRWSASPNAGLVHFKGTIKDSAGQPVNGFSVLLENGAWSVLSHPTGASRHYPDVPEGTWDLLIKNATDAAGWWVLTVVSYDCPDFEGGFNAQCKQFTRLSEPQIVKIVYPDRTVIKADWLCQQACDQGLYQEPYRP